MRYCTFLLFLLGERQFLLYREGEAPAEPKPSSAGASLSREAMKAASELQKVLDQFTNARPAELDLAYASLSNSCYNLWLPLFAICE